MFDLRTIAELIILFFTCSILGWVMEVVLKYIQYHRFINRGFFIGPYCPIYGSGALVITVIVGGLVARHGTIFETFLAGVVICGALEYFTSWYMEKKYHARWWDYSSKPMNLHGRIWIGNLIAFGLMSVIILYLVDNYFFSFLDKFSNPVIYAICIILIIAFLVDATVTHFLMNVIKQTIDSQEGDNTEEISKEVHALIKNKQLLVRRIYEAYPNLEVRPINLEKYLKELRRKTKIARKELKRVRAKLKKEFKASELELKESFIKARDIYREAKRNLRDAENRIYHKNDD